MKQNVMKLLLGVLTCGAMLAAPAALAADSAVASLPVHAAGGEALLEAALDLERTGTFATSCQSTYIGGDLWAGFSDQRAARAIQLAAAHQESTFCGAGIKVAVIDTGVDETHPLLAGAVLPGYDLLDPTGIGSDWSNLEHSVRAIVEHSVRAIVEQSTPAVILGNGRLAGGALAPVLDDDATVAFQETGLPPYFGHGTMVAGLIRLVAPGAKIVPVRAFDGNGTAKVSDLVQAIRWATGQGVQVINMSFSMEEAPQELRAAIRDAEARGIVLVAAVGNQGERLKIFPAALAEVIGAAAQSTAGDGQLADFSNFGPLVAELAAPGSATITTFPGGLFAAGWGTSFSAPLVSGAAALLFERLDRLAPNDQIRLALLLGATSCQTLYGRVRSGQLDVYRAWQLAGF